MDTIVAIARREVKRLRSGFGTNSRPVAVIVLVGALLISYLAFRQGFVLTRGMYRVGVSPGGPRIYDSRFYATVVDRRDGHRILWDRVIDLYVDGETVASRGDERSLNAAGALKRYLEKQELSRISEEHELDRAFPLRIEINYLANPAGTAPASVGQSLTELVEAFSSEGTEPGAPGTGAAADTSKDTGSEMSPLRSRSDSAVREQLWEMQSGGGGLANIEMEFASDKEILVPSLMQPPIPFAQVVIAFFYVLPVCFISVFFTSSFMTEKTGRRITVLLSAPVTPFQIIVGKMLPYILFSLASVVAITILLRGNLLLALAIFVPVVFFIFSVYLIVPLLYRTFRDTTFISMAAVSAITSYLVFPALFAGINDFAYMSPLTLAVRMYRDEPFGLREYLFATVPMGLLFFLSTYFATRMLNEEYLMGFRSLYRKIVEAIYLALDRNHPYLSITLLSVCSIPVVYMIQLVILALSANIPFTFALGGLLLAGAVVEEVAKSVGIAMLIENRIVGSTGQIVALSFLSSLGFLIAEKGLLLLSLSVVWESALSEALLSSGTLLVTLAAHFVFTSVVCLLTRRIGVRYYPLAVLAGSIVHGVYNLSVLGVLP